MSFSHWPRGPIAAVTAALGVLFVDWACQPDRAMVPQGPAAPAESPALASAPSGAGADSVRIHYVCANRFRIRSHNDSALAVQWAVLNTADTGTVLLPPRAGTALYSETHLDVPDSGTVRLFVAGVRIASAGNRGRACDARLLLVRVEAGVVATGPTGDSAYAVGTAVPYAFSPAPGYEHLLVSLDDSLVPASGTVVMGRSHVLWAAADVDVALPPASDPLVMELRSLLTAADPVATYQQILDDVRVLFDDVGPDAADRQVRLAGLVAYDLIRDSAAIARVDSALALHEFVVGESEYDGNGGGGGGGLIADRAPGGAARDAAPGRACASQRAPEMAGSPEPTRVLYVNGILTTPGEAYRTANALRCAMLRTGQIATSRILVRIFYNRTWSRQLPEDARANVWCVAAGVRWATLWSPLARVLAFGRCTAAAATIAIRTTDYIEALRQYTDVLANAPVAEPDADSLARYMAGVREREGQHVIVVAHSQGNLLTQQALGVLSARDQYAPRRDSLCIAAVAVAAPTSSNWPLPPDLLTGVQTPGDLLSLLTHHNHFPTVTTPYSDSTEAMVAELQRRIASARDRQERLALTEQLAVVRMVRGERLHSMDRTYLGDQPTRDAITGAVIHLHRQCTIGGIFLNPPFATLRVQSALPLDVSATNRNGATMNLNRGIEWDVPFRLTLSRTERRVRATAPGTSELGARVFDQRATSMIEVPMEALTVTASQSAHSAWKLIETSAPPSFPAPDPGAPPAWDGLASTCTQDRTLAAFDSATRFTYTWSYSQHCWFSASGSVEPPTGIRIAYYWWRWFDADGAPRDAPTSRHTTYSPPDIAADDPLAPFSGWGRLEVWGFNPDSVPIAKGEVCISHCGTAP
jgi:hypothetical protein